MTLTPNLKLEEIPANTRTWTDKMNNNLLLIDAAIGSYFVLQNLQGIWENSHAYTVGQTVVDGETAAVWTCQVDHISAGIPTTFAEERAANADYWSVYSSPARARGTWTPSTAYAINDFVVSGTQYAVCIATHTSSASFSVDVADGKWSILIDLSLVGSQVLPVLSGIVDQDKFVASNSLGTGYTIIDAAAALKILGASSIGQAVLQAVNAGDARAAINAQVAGNYQPLAAFLSLLGTLTPSNNAMPYIDNAGVAALAALSAFGRSLIDDADAATARSTLGLGSAALLTAGTGASNAVQLDGSAKLPAIDGSQLLNLPNTNPAQIVTSMPGTVATVTATTPFDDTIPQNTEGTEVLSVTITPRSSSSKMRITVNILGSMDVATATYCAALFRDSVADALAASWATASFNTGPANTSFSYTYAHGSSVAMTFKVRVGVSSNTFTLNGSGGVRLFGGVMGSSITVEEIQA